MTAPITRYRCTSCGNLTRFDLTVTRRTVAFHHYTVGGELTVEQEDVVSEAVEQVRCRWCGPSGVVEVVPEPAPGDARDLTLAEKAVTAPADDGAMHPAEPVPAPVGPTVGPEPLVIDCDACACQHTSVCADCVVTFVCNREPNEGVVVDVAEFRALRALGDAGLVPHLRHVRRTG